MAAFETNSFWVKSIKKLPYSVFFCTLLPKITLFDERSKLKFTKRGMKKFRDNNIQVKMLEKSHPAVKKYLKPLFSKKAVLCIHLCPQISKCSFKVERKKTTSFRKSNISKKNTKNKKNKKKQKEKRTGKKELKYLKTYLINIYLRSLFIRFYYYYLCFLHET